MTNTFVQYNQLKIILYKKCFRLQIPVLVLFHFLLMDLYLTFVKKGETRIDFIVGTLWLQSCWLHLLDAFLETGRSREPLLYPRALVWPRRTTAELYRLLI